MTARKGRKPGDESWWVAVRRSRAEKTILVRGTSKADAQRRVDAGEGEAVDVHYYDIGPTKVIRRDTPASSRRSKGVD